MPVGPHPYCCCEVAPGVFDFYADVVGVADYTPAFLFLTPSRWPAGTDYLGAVELYTSVAEGWSVPIDANPALHHGIWRRTLATALGPDEIVYAVRDGNPDHPDADGTLLTSAVEQNFYNWSVGADASFDGVEDLLSATATPTAAAYVEDSLAVSSSTSYELLLQVAYDSHQWLGIQLRDLTGSGSTTTHYVDLIAGTGATSVEELDDGSFLVHVSFTTGASPGSPAVRVHLAESGSLTFNSPTTHKVKLIGAWLRDANPGTSAIDLPIFDAGIEDCLAIRFVRQWEATIFRSEYTDSYYAAWFLPVPRLLTLAAVATNWTASARAADRSTIGGEESWLATGTSIDTGNVAADAPDMCLHRSNFVLQAISCDADQIAFWRTGEGERTFAEDVEINSVFAWSATGRVRDMGWGLDWIDIERPVPQLPYDTATLSPSDPDLGDKLQAIVDATNSADGKTPIARIVAIPPHDFPNCFGVQNPLGQFRLTLFPTVTPDYDRTETWTQTASITFGGYTVATRSIYNHNLIPFTLDQVGFQDVPILSAPDTTWFTVSHTEPRLHAATVLTPFDYSQTGAEGLPAHVWIRVLWADSLDGIPAAIFVVGKATGVTIVASGSGYPYHEEAAVELTLYVRINATNVLVEQIWRDEEATATDPNCWAQGLKAFRGPAGVVRFAYFEKNWATAPSESTPGTPDADEPWRLRVFNSAGTELWHIDGGKDLDLEATTNDPWVVTASDEWIYVQEFYLCDDRVIGDWHVDWAISQDGATRWPTSAQIDDVDDQPLSLRTTRTLGGWSIIVDSVKRTALVTVAAGPTAWPDAVCT